jgi:hypothetical protein
MDFNLNEFKKHNPTANVRPAKDLADEKHLTMLKAIAPFTKAKVSKNVTSLDISYATRNSKLMLVLLPEWAPMFPPFNLARLSAVAKQAGYETRTIDGNIRCFNYYRTKVQPYGTLPFNLWDPSSSWHLVGENYLRDVHHIFEPTFLKIVDEIVEYNPELVGFTMYYINEEAVKWMARELKKRLPNVKIAVGGSNVQNGWFHSQPYYDYVVRGEGEQAILTILDEIERGINVTETKKIFQAEDQRINLNDLPMPDYTGINFNEYEIPNGVNSELSRGCTAKCTFCEETHFWKYRQRLAIDIIKEVEHLYYERGTDIFWFIDSLVNGDLKELRAFAKGVVAKDLKIHWTGYARCDGRMDLEYFKDLAASGCAMLNYGIESGSQHVLDDMDKGVTIAEMEQNFRDGKEVGIWAATNWIVGFPSETYQDFADTMTFLWRIRNMNINNIGAGVGYGQGPETIVGQNPMKFNVSAQKYMGHWITNDHKFGGVHVLTRVKSFAIYIDHLLTEVPYGYPVRPNLRKSHYTVTFNNPTVQNDIGYEKFNYEIIKTNINVHADSLVNEIWPLLRTMWRARGGYTAHIKFSPELDLTEFGDQYLPGGYAADYKFTITDDGLWDAEFSWDFKQIYVPGAHEERPIERRGPFFAQDYSRLKGNTSTRARKLARPPWGEDGRDGHDFNILLKEEEILNQTVDWTFDYKWSSTGDWSNWKDYAVEVSTVKKEAINYAPVTFLPQLK